MTFMHEWSRDHMEFHSNPMFLFWCGTPSPSSSNCCFQATQLTGAKAWHSRVVACAVSHMAARWVLASPRHLPGMRPWAASTLTSGGLPAPLQRDAICSQSSNHVGGQTSQGTHVCWVWVVAPFIHSCLSSMLAEAWLWETPGYRQLTSWRRGAHTSMHCRCWTGSR